jgi:hypothetical protein
MTQQRDAGTVGEDLAVVIDLENMLHPERQLSGAAVRAGLTALVGHLATLGRARWVSSCCDFYLARMLCPSAALLKVRVFPGPIGKDRADRELVRRIRDVPASCSVLVIASGDGIFAGSAREQRARGRRVVVIARDGSLSEALRAEADEVVVLGTGPLTPGSHAAARAAGGRGQPIRQGDVHPGGGASLLGPAGGASASPATASPWVAKSRPGSGLTSSNCSPASITRSPARRRRQTALTSQ